VQRARCFEHRTDTVGCAHSAARSAGLLCEIDLIQLLNDVFELMRNHFDVAVRDVTWATMRPAEDLEIEVIPRTPPANGTVTMRTWIVSESSLAIREHCRRNDAERASIVSRNERYFGPTEMFSGTASCWL